MTTLAETTSPTLPDSVAPELQATLVELVELALQGKQAHWNVTGPNFRSVHLELDEIVDAARLASDRVAERIVTIGRSPDGRAATVASTPPFSPFPTGAVGAAQVVEIIGARIDELAGRMRERIGRLGEIDPVSQGILVDVDEELEKQAWMLRAQLA
ncbi:MAG: DNA starvation/stationary phase protection protein [Chloroflexi bacterium]|nr:DNA starvation/stationary phase protection protein [Chloroflexota bacterium]